MPTIVYSLNSLNAILKKAKPSKVCIVTSDVLEEKLGWAIREIEHPDIEMILVPDGEDAKQWRELETLLQQFSELHLDRTSIVIAFGGGTVGDLVGFAAGIYLRGIPYIQVPTTLLAQVDSAHGGKTGINFLKYKNQIGMFNRPIATVIDVRFIRYLSQEQIADGLGEIIKAGFIKDKSILAILQKETLATLSESPRLMQLIKKSIKVKIDYTEKDFKDATVRQLLNAGHTIGHAIELKYKISHGRAVILGLIQELAFTESLGMTSPSVRDALLALLRHLDIDVDETMTADWPAITHDKKVSGKSIYFPVISKEGASKMILLDLDVLKKFVEEA
jgi:3-dehydroquinate synthase